MKWHQVIAVLFSIAVLAAGCGAGCGKEAKAPDDIAFTPSVIRQKSTIWSETGMGNLRCAGKRKPRQAWICV